MTVGLEIPLDYGDQRGTQNREKCLLTEKRLHPVRQEVKQFVRLSPQNGGENG